jgi:hypothetical protein
VLRRTVHSSADLPPEGILVPDAAVAEDVKRLAELVDDATLAAGAADFFAALLEARGKGRAGGAAGAARPFVVPPALLVCGSPTGWRQRAGQCRRSGLEVYVWHETPADDRGGDFFPLVPAEAEALAARVNACGAIVMALGDPQVPRPQAEAMLARFCQTSAQFAALAQPLSLLVEGGATAGLLVAALDWQCFDVLPQGCPGVGLLVPRGGVPRPASPLVLDNQPAMATPKSKGTAPAEEPRSSFTPRLWIKPGSYLWPDEVWEDLVFCTCSQAVAPPRAAGPWASPPPA